MSRSSARVYDLIYGSFKDYAAEAAAIAGIVRERVPNASSLLDVGCGTGVHLEFLRAEFDVAGLDIDPSMLEVAKARLPGVDLREADMRDFDLDRRFDAVICLFSAIGYMPDVADLNRAIVRMAAHLVEGGVLIVDGWVRPDAWLARPGEITLDMDSAENEETRVVRVSRNLRTGDVTDLEMQYLVATRYGIEHFTDSHRLTLFSDREYREAFAASGLVAGIVPGPMKGRDRYVAVRGG